MSVDDYRGVLRPANRCPACGNRPAYCTCPGGPFAPPPPPPPSDPADAFTHLDALLCDGPPILSNDWGEFCAYCQGDADTDPVRHEIDCVWRAARIYFDNLPSAPSETNKP